MCYYLRGRRLIKSIESVIKLHFIRVVLGLIIYQEMKKMNDNCIPKIIHYCWFGGNPLPDLARKCIESWKKYCPDYEIKQWDETNFDLDCCDYVREAYQEKKWAFVSDYARFKIIYENGGVYFDTDVELIKSIDDIVDKGAFMALEKSDKISVAAGLGLAGYAGLTLFEDILNSYHHSHFERNENYSYETVVTRVTNIILKQGIIHKNHISEVAGVIIYPSEYFCPLDFNTNKMKITNNTRSIHHYTASWYNKTQRCILFIKRRFANQPHIANLLILPLHGFEILNSYGFGEFVKRLLRKLT